MRLLLCALLMTGTLAACGKPDQPGAGSAAARQSGGEAVTLLLAAEDILTVQASTLASGALISGAVQPGRRADLRAEVASFVTQVLKDNGETVRAGELLMRLDQTSLRESLASAEAASRAAQQTVEQAERQLQRLKTLQQQGMATAQALDDASTRRNNAGSELVGARSRVVAARQQLQRTLVSAPFDGVVSERKVSVGDTVQVGRELVKVIDPRSMRFEGLVAADRLDELKIGQSVSFHINGFGDGDFQGTVTRIDAAVNAATRQVAVIVGFDEPQRAPRVAGLFAEGRIAGGGTPVPTIPASAVQRAGDSSYVWRLGDGRLTRLALRLGDRDPRSGVYPVLDGLASGERILAHPTGSLADGQHFEIASAGTLAATPAAAAAASAAK